MNEADLEFPEAPLSPSLPSDFLEPGISKSISKSAPSKPSLSKSSPPESQTESQQEPSTDQSGKPSSKSSSTRSGPKPASRQSSRTEPLDPEDERKMKELGTKMARWVDRARSKKHDSDRARQDRKHRLSCVLALDAVVCFMIGFDYEDRSEAIRVSASIGTPIHARSWSTLVPYLAKLASTCESVDADLAGVYYQICAVVRLHVNYLQRRSMPPDECARGLYSALSDFRRGLALLPLHIINNRYGLNESSGWLQTKINQEKPDPLYNSAALPLHVNSSLAEAAAFALNVGKKWAKIEGINYVWEASKM